MAPTWAVPGLFQLSFSETLKILETAETIHLQASGPKAAAAGFKAVAAVPNWFTPEVKPEKVAGITPAWAEITALVSLRYFTANTEHYRKDLKANLRQEQQNGRWNSEWLTGSRQ